VKAPDIEKLEDLRGRLGRFLLRIHGARAADIRALRLLTGGASRQTWSFDAALDLPDGSTREMALVLRSDLPSGASFMPRDVEYRVLEAVHHDGVPVPRVHAMGDDSLDAPFFLMERVEGETIARRILRDEHFAPARAAMVRQLGAILAHIHRVPVGGHGLAMLPGAASAAPSAAADECERYEQLYRAITPDPHPAFEVAFRWLRANLPPADAEGTSGVDGGRALVHGDFRLGNLIVGPEGIRAVLDWELAHVGDPIEDLGWLCVRSWRFGNDQLPAAGVGTREELWAAYEAAGGIRVDAERARFWEVFGNLRWGIISIVQARTYLDGHSRSVELASIGRRVAETEWEILALLDAA
jgi:aminoglycoside phosphotransferase (APT) family kinase protein